MICRTAWGDVNLWNILRGPGITKSQNSLANVIVYPRSAIYLTNFVVVLRETEAVCEE